MSKKEIAKKKIKVASDLFKVSSHYCNDPKFSIRAKSADPDQTAPRGAVLLFARS